MAQTVRPAILVVDDDMRNLFAMEEVLRDADHEIIQAKSGEEALRHLLTRDFALILMDVQMPDLDGYQTAELIRGRERCRQVPIIFVTAFNKDEHHIFRGYAAGAVDYIFKPIDPVILKSKVTVFLDLFRKAEEIKRQSAVEKALLEEMLRARAERLRSERELRRRDEQYGLIVRSLPIALYTADAAGRLRFVSDNIEAMTGFAASLFVEEEGFWDGQLHPEDRDRVLDRLATIAERGTVSCEYRWICADGSERHILDQAVLVSEEQGRGAEIFGTWLDVTDRKQLEVQLERSRRLESVGRLTGGIAHDFNNMLSVVIGNIDMLQRTIEAQPEAERLAAMALKGALRCADLTKRLLAFARRQPLAPKIIDLGEFVESMTDLLARTLGNDIQVSYEAVADLPAISADPAHVESALLNLVFNARDAMPEGGRLIIRLEGARLAEDGLPDDCRPGDYVVLSVVDTGVGMPPEVLGKALEPFFTTKEIGRGTGLGLSTTYGFLKQVGGHIDIESRVGEGTRVRLYFPVAAPGARPAEPAPAAPTSDGDPADVDGAVLVVEDEAEVRELAVNVLSRLGFTVVEAADGRSALDILDRRDDVQLLFTDIMMPGMNGIELATEATRRHPSLKVLYTSGYGDVGNGEEQRLNLLRKPYRAQELSVSIRGLLEPAQG